ncbi:Uu.00g090070.m01.CDS01 [Anthostomella pinea]|uniref:Uu.00g090070.m01.CDS01 n=1 Tax=Anthostomella pinea TaxID=933095 RepID=A0AAI8VMR7_9PEZI|nr:Uu.00g090070.m01.CDS01 [Anthostomella pinea]
MENLPPVPAQLPAQDRSPDLSPGGRKRSGSGGGILSKFPFLRTSESKSSLNESRNIAIAEDATSRPPRALATISHQQKTRRRKGSLRKVALLGRGAARERRELTPLAITTTTQPAEAAVQPMVESPSSLSTPGSEEFGLGISDLTPRPSMDGFARRVPVPIPPPPAPDSDSQVTSPTISYTSTTDEEDVLSIPVNIPPPLLGPELSSLSSGSDSYFPPSRALSPSIQRRRSVKHAKSPLSLQGLTANPLPAADEDHDYSETEWWGWVVLVVTWFVFIIGMGSCLNIWSWAWDVGTTPYAPPELEDDPTLPIAGYYPALLILTCIMAWVWVVVAWTGMKYFRHAKISGD